MHTCSDTEQIEYVVSNLDRALTLAGRVSLARSSATRRKGLLGIDRLSPGAGLWILPCEAIHTFGMRMAIDVIFLDRKLNVRKIRPHLPPWRISICIAADSVLELEAGAIARTRTVVGDRLSFEPAAAFGQPRRFADKLTSKCL